MASSRFLSTPSAKRATESAERETVDEEISIHALREEGDMSPCAIRCDTAISIHALREEGDVF